MVEQPTFSDKLFGLVREKQSAVVVGIDPDPALIPRGFFPDPLPSSRLREAVAEGVLKFSQEVLHAVHDVAVAVKPQLAYFERLGPPGWEAFEEVVRAAHALGLLVIADGKRNDIASTASQYALAYLADGEGASSSEADPWLRSLRAVDEEGPKCDALTVNPYLGWDGIDPFLVTEARGLFVLVKTSNPSSGQLQDLRVTHSESSVAEGVADMLEGHAHWGMGSLGYGSIGAVVGATYPDQLRALRRRMPRVPFLIPGFGTQGGTAQDVAAAFDPEGLGAIVNASRSILYAYRRFGGDVGTSARRAAIEMRDALREVW